MLNEDFRTLPEKNYPNPTKIEPFNFKLVEAPFSTTEVLNLADKDWTQLNCREDHIIYATETGNVQFKHGKGLFGPYYECVAYELSQDLGLSVPPTTAAYSVGMGNEYILGVLSFAPFPYTMQDFKGLEDFVFSSCNPTLLTGETVASVWWRNRDWSLNSGQIAFGFYEGRFYYYVFDRDRIFKGPTGEIDLNQVRNNFDLREAFWPRKYLKIQLSDCIPYIERIENINEKRLIDICCGWAKKLAAIDINNADSYARIANELSRWLIFYKEHIKRDLKNFFSGAEWALSC